MADEIVKVVAIVSLLITIIFLITQSTSESFAPVTANGKSSWDNGASINTIKATTLEASNLGSGISGFISNMITTAIDKRIVESIYPIGTIMVRYDTKNPKTLSGLGGTTWTLINSGSYIRTTTSETQVPGASGTTGGSLYTGTGTSGSNSSSTVASNSGSHILTTTQIPSHTHTTVSGGTHNHPLSIGTRGVRSGSDYRVYSNTYNDAWSSTYISMSSAGAHTHALSATGGSGGHSHSIPSLTVNSHSHSIPALSIEPTYARFAFWRRTA